MGQEGTAQREAVHVECAAQSVARVHALCAVVMERDAQVAEMQARHDAEVAALQKEAGVKEGAALLQLEAERAAERAALLEAKSEGDGRVREALAVAQAAEEKGVALQREMAQYGEDIQRAAQVYEEETRAAQAVAAKQEVQMQVCCVQSAHVYLRRSSQITACMHAVWKLYMDGCTHTPAHS